MNYLDQQYNSTQYPIIVTENGISSKGNGTDEDPELNDHWRADFYHGYIGQLHRAVTEDKINVFGYTGNSNEPFHGDIFTHGLIYSFRSEKEKLLTYYLFSLVNDGQF